MLRPFGSRQLGLWGDREHVVVFAVMGGRFAGPTLQVHAPTLLQRLEQLSPDIDTLVFVDEPFPDSAMVERIDDMLEQFASQQVDALAAYVAATEAIKRVHGDQVLHGVDRSTLIAVKGPEIISREALVRAVDIMDSRPWTCPLLLVARSGGRVARYQGPIMKDENAR